jgi:LysM repeat protein
MGLDTSDQRAVCVGVNATDVRATTGTTGAITPTGIATPTRTSAGPTSSKPVAPPAQTQAGIAASCRAYHVAMRGDGCWAISNQNGITLDEFYAWNPAGKSSIRVR